MYRKLHHIFNKCIGIQKPKLLIKEEWLCLDYLFYLFNSHTQHIALVHLAISVGVDPLVIVWSNLVIWLRQQELGQYSDGCLPFPRAVREATN